jgi:hypothetical protein
MHVPWIKRVSPALVVAMIGLFVALGGTAGASGQAPVPLAKRALVADNAKKVGGLTAPQVAAAGAKAALALSPEGARPASTAAGLVVIKTQAAGIVPPGGSLPAFSVSCDTGAKVIGGGMSSDGAIVTFDSYPKGDAAWEVVVGNFGSGAANVSVYAICLR